MYNIGICDIINSKLINKEKRRIHSHFSRMVMRKNMSIGDLIIQIASKGIGAEYNELENSFFTLIGNIIVSFVFIIGSVFIAKGVTGRLLLLAVTAFSLFMLTRNAVTFKNLMKQEQ